MNENGPLQLPKCRFVVFFLAVFFCINLPAMAAESQGVIPKPRPERHVVFPKTFKMGEVSHQPWGNIVPVSEISRTDARGRINIPAGAQVEYFYSARDDREWGWGPALNEDYHIDFNALSKLDPYAIQFLHLSYLGRDAAAPKFKRFLDALKNQKALLAVELIQCNLGADELAPLMAHPTLQAIYFLKCGLAFTYLKNHPGIKRIEITQGGMAGVKSLAGWPALESVCLFGLLLKDPDLVELSKLIKLKELRLDYMKLLTGPGLQCLRNLKNLEILSLSENAQFGDKDFSFLKDLQSLKELDLRITPFSDNEIPYIASLKNLKEINLGETSVTSAGVEKLKKANPGLKVNMVARRN